MMMQGFKIVIFRNALIFLYIYINYHGHIMVILITGELSMFLGVCVYLGLTSLSTIFQSYHDGCLVATGSSMLTFIVLPH